jgi:hypothetical protein
MSTELPFVEAQLDALTNTIWWTLDQKFGRVARPLSPPTMLSRLQQIWDSLYDRLSIALGAPYLLAAFDMCERPGRLVLWLWTLCLLGPWIYQIFVYAKFLDPLRKLPGPKVSHRSNARLILGTLVIWLGLGCPQRRCNPHFRSHLDPNHCFPFHNGFGVLIVHSWASSNNISPAPSPQNTTPTASSPTSPSAVGA